MNLTLEIVSPNARTLGPACRKVFGPEGGRIGRSPDCDWVLPNPYISRHHATVRWISGTYYIESTGDNGVAIGSLQAMLPQLERRALKNGDRVFIDEYEIVVNLAGAVEEPAPHLGSTSSLGFVPTEDPFGELGPTRNSRALVDPFEPAQEELDPLKQLSGRPRSPVVTAPRHDSSWNHTPGVSDHFAPPPVQQAGSVIPDDWDHTAFGRKPAATGAPAGPAGGGGTTFGAAPGTIPDDWDKTTFGRKGPAAAAGAPPAAPLRPSPQPPNPAPPIAPRVNPPRAMPPAAPQSGAPGSTGARPAPRAPPPMGSGASAAAPQWPIPETPRAVVPPSAPTQTGSQAASFDVTALLRGAGVDPATVSPATAAALGLILRSVVQGVIEVLQARAEIKNQFRLTQTRVKTTENNPLKFAVNAEDALGQLLGRRNPAYLPPVEAFEDAFDDIRFHQMAMLTGMRAGFQNVLERFDPEQLQEVFEKQVKRGGLLSMNVKSRFWEMYQEEFQRFAGDPEEAFRRLFGEEFASAYEKQLEALKRSRNKPSR
jgi:type VI secretion system FHA domain protein